MFPKLKILIIKTSALGDILHTFPVLQYLREQFPFSQIDWIVEKKFSELVSAHPHVNQVFTIESKKWRKGLLHYRQDILDFRQRLRKEKYEVVFDLQGNLKSSLILMQSKAKDKVGFGRKSVPEWPNLFFTNKKFNPLPYHQNIREDYLSIVKSYYKDATPYKIEPIPLNLTSLGQSQVDEVLSDAVLVCPGAAWPNKQLSEKKFIDFLTELNQPPYLFAWGTEVEREMSSRLAAHFPGSLVLQRYSFPVLQHIMAKCQLVIAMDSLPLHLCATTSTPSISFFGPSSSSKYRPIGEKHITFQGQCPYGVTFEKRCPKLRTCKTGACLKEL